MSINASSVTSTINTRSSQSRDSSQPPCSGGGGGGGKQTPFNQNTRDFFCRTSTNERSLNGGTANTTRRSPVSPSRITRLQEKEEMQNLNDRLVIYIETVRRLESENFRLKNEVQSYTEVSTRDVAEIKVLYEKELEDAKRLIDELARDKAKYEIEVNKHKANAQEAVDKFDRRDREAKDATSRYLSVESELLEYKRRCELTSNDLARKSDELKLLKPHNIELEKQLAKLKKQLEDETLARVDLENKNTTLKEDLNFKSQIYDKETDQLRSSKRVEIEQVDCRLRDEYESKLMTELNLIREEADTKIREMKDEVERRYQNKFYDADANVKRGQQTIAALREDLQMQRVKLDEYELDMKNQLIKIGNYEAKCKEHEERVKKLNVKYETEIAGKDKEIDESKKELGALLHDYQELYDIKIGLDMEIEAYRKLLESEEKRLNISNYSLHNSYLDGMAGALSSTAAAGNESSAVRGKKRKVNAEPESPEASDSSVYEQSHDAKLGIEICEHDFQGKWVKLLNKTDKDIAIGGWQLRRTADSSNTDYKMPKATTLKAGQSLTVWSSNMADAAQSTDLVMSKQQWCTGAKIITVLFDKDTAETARRECLKLAQVPDKKLKDSRVSLISTKTTETRTETTSSSSSLVGKLMGGLWR